MNVLRMVSDTDYDVISELTDLIGAESTLAIVKRFGGESIYIPLLETLSKNERNRSVYADYLAGMTYKDIKSKYGLSINTVRGIISDKRKGG